MLASPVRQREEGAPEWMVSYADMITILMAFFVVMYSMSDIVDINKEQAVAHSLRVNLGPFIGMGPAPLGSGKANVSIRRAGSNGKQPDPSQSPVPVDNTVQNRAALVATARPGERLAIGGVLVFADGSDQLSDAARRTLAAIAGELAGKPQRIEIRAFSTRRPLPTGASFADSWELAYARCRATMKYLVELGVDPRRMHLGVAAIGAPRRISGEETASSPDTVVEIIMLNEFVEAADAENSGAPAAPTATQTPANS